MSNFHHQPGDFFRTVMTQYCSRWYSCACVGALTSDLSSNSSLKDFLQYSNDFLGSICLPVYSSTQGSIVPYIF